MNLYRNKKYYTFYENYLYYKIDFVFNKYSIVNTTHTDLQTITPTYKQHRILQVNQLYSLSTLQVYQL